MSRASQEPSIQLVKTDGQNVLCEECSRRAVQRKCLKCEAFYCQICFAKIHNNKTLSNHQYTSVDQVDEIKTDVTSLVSTEQTRLCSAHNRVIELLCNVCNKQICMQCAAIDTCRGHDVVPLRDITGVSVEKIETALERCERVLTTLRKSKSALNRTLQDQSREVIKLKEEIQKHFHKQHDALKLRERKILYQLTMDYEDSVKYFESLSKDIECGISEVKSMIQGAQITLDNSNHSRKIMKQTLESLDRVIETQGCYIREECLHHNASFTANKEPLETEISTFGNVTLITPNNITLLPLSATPSDDLDLSTDCASPKPSTESAAEASYAKMSSLDEDMAALSRLAEETSKRSAPPSARYNHQQHERSQLQPGSSQLRTVSQSSDSPRQQHATSGESASESLKIPALDIDINFLQTVRMTNIRSPDLFYVHIFGEIENLNKMQKQLNLHCKSKNARIPATIAAGDIVAAQFDKDQLWYRTEILQAKFAAKEGKDVLLAEVYYLDYGNSQWVNKTSLRVLPAKFCSLAKMAIPCKLYDIVPVNKAEGWTPESRVDFSKMTGDKVLSMSIQKTDLSNELSLVDLFPEQNINLHTVKSSVRDNLVFLEHACLLSEYSSGDPKKRGVAKGTTDYLRINKPIVGAKCNALVCHVNSLESFYMQLIVQNAEEIKLLEKMMQDIQTVYSSELSLTWTIYCPQKGMLCLCQFTQDNRWYRARILSVQRKMVEVQYVDYGNIEIVPYTRLKYMQKDHLGLSQQGYHCQLYAPPGVDLKTHPAAPQCIKYLSSLERAVVEVKDHKDDKLCVQVMRMDDGLIVNQLLAPAQAPTDASTNKGMEEKRTSKDPAKEPINQMPEDVEVIKNFDDGQKIVPEPAYPGQKKLAMARRRAYDYAPKSPNETIDDDTPDAKKAVQEQQIIVFQSTRRRQLNPVVISHTVDPGHFYLQAAHSVDDLNKLVKDITEYYEHSKAEKHTYRDGEVCVAKMLDGRWCRAKIRTLNHQAANVEVFLFDYGYTLTLPLSDIRPMARDVGKARWLKTPAMCVRCHLTGIVPSGGTGKWSGVAIDAFKDRLKAGGTLLYTKGDKIKLPCGNFSLPVCLAWETHEEGSALTADTYSYHSINEMLKVYGYAFDEQYAITSPSLKESSNSEQRSSSAAQQIDLNVNKEDNQPSTASTSQSLPSPDAREQGFVVVDASSATEQPSISCMSDKSKSEVDTSATHTGSELNTSMSCASAASVSTTMSTAEQANTPVSKHPSQSTSDLSTPGCQLSQSNASVSQTSDHSSSHSSRLSSHHGSLRSIDQAISPSLHETGDHQSTQHSQNGSSRLIGGQRSPLQQGAASDDGGSSVNTTTSNKEYLTPADSPSNTQAPSQQTVVASDSHMQYSDADVSEERDASSGGAASAATSLAHSPSEAGTPTRTVSRDSIHAADASSHDEHHQNRVVTVDHEGRIIVTSQDIVVEDGDESSASCGSLSSSHSKEDSDSDVKGDDGDISEDQLDEADGAAADGDKHEAELTVDDLTAGNAEVLTELDLDQESIQDFAKQMNKQAQEYSNREKQRESAPVKRNAVGRIRGQCTAAAAMDSSDSDLCILDKDGDTGPRKRTGDLLCEEFDSDYGRGTHHRHAIIAGGSSATSTTNSNGTASDGNISDDEREDDEEMGGVGDSDCYQEEQHMNNEAELLELLHSEQVACPYPQLIKFKVHDRFPIVITSIDSPTMMHVQFLHIEGPPATLSEKELLINKHCDKLFQILEEINANSYSYKQLDLDKIQPGDPCLALYSADSAWYRAYILCIKHTPTSPIIGVHFIDYGNTEFVNPECVRQLPAHMLHTAPASFMCHLHQYKDIGTYTKEQLDQLSLLDRPCRVVCKSASKLHTKVIEVELFTEAQKQGVVQYIALHTYLEKKEMVKHVDSDHN